MRILLALLMTSAMFLAACDQDPLSGAPDPVRTGERPDFGKPAPVKAVPEDFMMIDVADIRGRVGSLMELNISGRVLLPNVNHTMGIENLIDFPGATYDATTGIFSWTPTKSLMGGQMEMAFPLNVVMYTEASSDYPVASRRVKQVMITIENQASKPIVKSVSVNATKLLAGRSYQVSFAVEDLDATSASDIRIYPSNCTKSYDNSIAAYVSRYMTIEPTTTPGQFTGRLTLDLSDADYIASGEYCFGLSATSKRGETSALVETEIDVEAKLPQSRSTLSSNVEMTVGEKKKISFSIFDPSQNGEITLDKDLDISKDFPGSTVTCESVKDWLLTCEVIIDATTTVSSVYSYDLNVTNSAGGTSNQAVKNKHTLTIDVKAANP